MSRLIDVDEFIKVASTTDLLEGNRWIRRKVLDIIEAFPTITERTATLKLDRGQKYCSECFERALSYYYYCPNCGAKFEEVSDGR